jgi:hypothetical protein
MARYHGRLGGAFKLAYGASAFGAGFSKVGLGLHKAYAGAKARRPFELGKGLEKAFAGARAIRSGFRNTRQGFRSVKGVVGHPFYGNQFTKVARAGAAAGSTEKTHQHIHIHMGGRRLSAGRRSAVGRRGSQRQLTSGRGTRRGRSGRKR